eukprot:4263086-Amphidinium_carterae.2
MGTELNSTTLPIVQRQLIEIGEARIEQRYDTLSHYNCYIFVGADFAQSVHWSALHHCSPVGCAVQGVRTASFW